jgi:ribonuclease HII
MVHSRLERRLRKAGFNLIAGIDEAGRGPLAGPVFSSAVVFPDNSYIKGLDDSKKLTPLQREKIYKVIFHKALYIGIGIVSEKVIDKKNILQATLLSMKKAVVKLAKKPDYILVDGNKTIPDIGILQKSIVGGDGICSSIAAASIIAKVSRDRYMLKLHKKYPQYGFDKHKGYGTEAHFMAIEKYGPCPVHRKTFIKNPR